MHICVGKLTIIASDNDLSPGRRQAIIWTKAGLLLIGPLGTNFNEILIEIHTFSFKKMHLKMSSLKWHPFSLGLNVLITEAKLLKWFLVNLCNICWNTYMTIYHQKTIRYASRRMIIFQLAIQQPESPKIGTDERLHYHQETATGRETSSRSSPVFTLIIKTYVRYHIIRKCECHVTK